VTTAAGVVNNDARLKIGESVVIFGTGGVGLNLVQFAALAGGHPIVAVDLLDHKLEMARTRGATHTINAARVNDVPGAIRDIVGAGGPDKVIETTGVKSVIESAYELTHKDGTIVLVGVPHEKVTINTLPIHFNKILTGSEGGSAKPDIDIPRIIRLVKGGRLSFDGIITDEFALADINPAFDLVRSGKAGRVLLRVAEA
jgi:S-(hydroxymethyl)glutathione dehydrogenase / alcohol dehydrogenase